VIAIKIIKITMKIQFILQFDISKRAFSMLCRNNQEVRDFTKARKKKKREYKS